MPGFWRTFKPFSSTTGHLNAQRGNAVAQLINDTFDSFSPSAILPGKFAQALLSGHALFSHGAQPHERLIHLLQTLTATVQMGIAIAMLFGSEDCDEFNSNICKAALVSNLIYKGTLLTGWAPSEYAKVETPPQAGYEALNP